jgi:cardiolipin synthase A/B
MRRKLSLFQVIVLAAPVLLSSCATDQALRKQLAHVSPVTDAAFENSLQELVGIKLVDGNQIVELVNGEEFFPAMIEAVRQAQQSVNFENFVWRSGEISTQFIEALAERSRAGVKVHFLVDALGAGKLNDADWKKLLDADVEVAKYNPPGFTNFLRVGHRTHRKILIVDGKIGFIGGISIADEWFYQTKNPGRWRDSNYRLKGPVVAQLQRIFCVNWMQATDASLRGEKYFPDLETAGSTEAACFMSGPGEDEKNSRRIYLLSIAAAQKSIRLAHSYFVPDNFARQLLLDARKRGVKIEILTPGILNYNIVRRASRSRWKKLLDAGVEFYEYEPTKYHLKLMIVDDVWVTAGSVNFDARSFRINDEANFVARDRDFAETQIATFEKDKSLCRSVNAEDFNRRSFWTKSVEHMAGLLRFQL